MDIPSNYDRVAALIAGIGDRIAAEQRVIAAAEARVVKLFADAARVSDLTAQTMMPAGTSAVRARELARLSLQLEFSAMTRIPERSIVQRIAESEVLVRELPETLAALAAGAISVGHARVIVDQCAEVLPGDRSEFESRILPVAMTRTASQLKQRARVLREKLHPRSIAARHDAAKRERHVVLSPAADGMSWLSMLTTAPIAAAAHGRLVELAVQGQRDGDPRTRAQLMTDHAQSLLLFGVTATSSGATVLPAESALSQGGTTASPAESGVSLGGAAVLPAAEGGVGGGRAAVPAEAEDLPPWAAASSGGGTEAPARKTVKRVPCEPVPGPERIIEGVVPVVHVTVPVMTLLGVEDAPGSLEGYGPIDAETAARLTVNAKSFTRILTHPETGAVLSVGRDRYAPPSDLKRALAIRDVHCRAPGCSRLAKGCDLDHTIPWSEGGETSASNLAHLCPKHHHVKHDTNWSLTSGPGGVLRWRTPSGREFTTEPDPPDWLPLEPRS